jgi:hypothetical protein
MFKNVNKTLGSVRQKPRTARPLSTSNLTPAAKVKAQLKALTSKVEVRSALLEIHKSLYDELVDWSTTKAKAGIENSKERHTSPELQDAAETYSIAFGLRAVCDMTKNYNLKPIVNEVGKQPDTQKADAEFFAQIRPDHAKTIRGDFLGTWRCNSLERQAAILSALAPGIIERIGIDTTPEQRNLAATWQSLPIQMRLLESEFLALLDYLNSSTGTFNAVNSAAVAQAYYGEPVLQQLVTGFSAPLDSAITKLCHHPYFGLKDIVTYKGIKLENDAGSFRIAMLDAAVGTRKTIAFPNVLSTTCNEHMSYASTKPDEGYSTELQITMRRGVLADPFHDESTMGEMEVLGPRGQKFIVSAKTELIVRNPNTGSSIPINRYILLPKD